MIETVLADRRTEYYARHCLAAVQLCEVLPLAGAPFAACAVVRLRMLTERWCCCACRARVRAQRCSGARLDVVCANRRWRVKLSGARGRSGGCECRVARGLEPRARAASCGAVVVGDSQRLLERPYRPACARCDDGAVLGCSARAHDCWRRRVRALLGQELCRARAAKHSACWRRARRRCCRWRQCCRDCCDVGGNRRTWCDASLGRGTSRRRRRRAARGAVFADIAGVCGGPVAAQLLVSRVRAVCTAYVRVVAGCAACARQWCSPARVRVRAQDGSSPRCRCCCCTSTRRATRVTFRWLRSCCTCVSTAWEVRRRRPETHSERVSASA